ncbi:MAG: 3-hydroxyisobutyrate dehydrogenase [Betaproteobacteria bacterium]|jgi:3-hydroxyisobutyrate dehydrogenase-like beta-hydroxyacid dehydrogenase|nr:3-hydroxyisobutyrate dehydrogenase [Betaproteobacteria bacterium]
MSETVGVVGAGRMGLPIIGHLARAGFRTLASDIDPKKRAEVERRGATWQADLSGQCDAILVCVGFDREVGELLERGLKPRADGIVAILSTVHPKTVQDLAAKAKGMHVIDSTVCRGGEAADKGTLLSFVGGPAEVVARITPVLRAYSSDVVHTGDVGSAQVAKAVNNLILWACLVADHEGLALAQRFGLDVEKLRQALLMSSATNDALEKWGRQTMAWAEDDMEIVAAMAAERGIALPQAEVTREICHSLKPRRYKLDDYGA